ncbi:MAG TPA: SDR family oxidoreductase [Ktedonobacteraceae bacterium]|nr:SDR family oxidoreductase [Ktedonobacteraceae bacterium]
MQHAKKVALITGANKGIGFETARQLGEQGVIVLAGARDRTRGDEAARALQAEGIEASAVHLDVTDQATIEAAASYIDETYGRLDIVVNNAGISLPEGRVVPSVLNIEVFRKMYDTNVFGVFAVTKAMLPLLRRSEAGRIVNMASSMGSLSLNSNPDSVYAQMPPLLGYNSSKTAVNAITVFFANELRNTSIKVNSADPGYCATDLNNHSGWRTPQQGAQVVVRLATLPADGPTGGFFDENGAVPW